MHENIEKSDTSKALVASQSSWSERARGGEVAVKVALRSLVSREDEGSLERGGESDRGRQRLAAG